MLRCPVQDHPFLLSIADKKRKNIKEKEKCGGIIPSHFIFVSAIRYKCRPSQKKEMVRAVLIVCLLLTVVSCGLKELGVVEASLKEGVWVSPEMSSSDLSAVVTTAFSYPEAFDWRSSDASGVKSSLIVFMGNDPLMRLAVGEGYQISQDPDRHRFVDGHLYTDFPADGTMVIKRDGRQCLTYKGEERIVGMIVENGHLYTLGIPSSGEGFSYRRDGQPLVSRYSCRVFERLEKDDDRICFAYCRKVVTTEGESDAYFIVRDGVEEPVLLPEHMDIVWDVVSHQGEVCFLASSTLTDRAYLCRNGVIRMLDMPVDSRLLWAEFIPGSGESLFAQGVYESGDAHEMSALWVDGDEYRLIDNGCPVSYACASSAGASCVLNPMTEDSPGMILKCGTVHRMPAGYNCIGRQPMVMNVGELVVGLSSTTGKRPLLWRDGVVDTLNINGYVCTSVLWCP